MSNHDPDEILAVVDENDIVVGSASRLKVHDECLLHRQVYVFVQNFKGDILLQKRKDTERWGASASGHFSANESYLEGAKRELKEEIGLDASEFEEVGYGLLDRENRRGRHRRFFKVYLVKSDSTDFVLEENEVLEVNFFSRDKLLKILENPKGVIMSSAIYLLKKYVL
jgi:isopentenyl-diphosphate Delta-isomerase